MRSERPRVMGGGFNCSGSVSGVVANKLIGHCSVPDSGGALWNGALCFLGAYCLEGLVRPVPLFYCLLPPSSPFALDGNFLLPEL